MAESASSRISQLASTISANTAIFDAYLASNGIPSLSFSTGTPSKIDVPQNIAEARDAVIDASGELQALLLGPRGHLQRQTWEVSN